MLPTTRIITTRTRTSIRGERSKNRNDGIMEFWKAKNYINSHPGLQYSNIPDIRDVNKLIELLQSLGVKIQKTGEGEYTFEASDVNLDYLNTPDFKKQAGSLRGSIMIVGPLLARFGQARIPRPGGDKIGR